MPKRNQNQSNPALLLAVLLLPLLVITAYLYHAKPLRADAIVGHPIGMQIDPNTANPAALALLPGIGPNIADGIIEHRETLGPFMCLEDLDNVRYIGPQTLQRIEPYVTLQREGE